MVNPPIVGVRFRRAGRIAFYRAGDQTLAVGDRVIVTTERGLELAHVVIAPDQFVSFVGDPPPGPIVRPATPEDLAQAERFRLSERRALEVVKDRIRSHALPMRPVDAAYTVDGKRLTIQFTADHRVDFRELVRDLAARFRTRIELRQIGDRDRAKALGGIGRCGRELCCSSFLHEYPAVSMKLAKLQDLSLNPSKITGACGRLLCCLAFEAETYLEMKQRMPKIGQTVETPAGAGRAIGLDVFEAKVRVQYPGGATDDLPLDAITWGVVAAR